MSSSFNPIKLEFIPHQSLAQSLEASSISPDRNNQFYFDLLNSKMINSTSNQFMKSNSSTANEHQVVSSESYPIPSISITFENSSDSSPLGSLSLSSSSAKNSLESAFKSNSIDSNSDLYSSISCNSSQVSSHHLEFKSNQPKLEGQRENLKILDDQEEEEDDDDDFVDAHESIEELNEKNDSIDPIEFSSTEPIWKLIDPSPNRHQVQVEVETKSDLASKNQVEFDLNPKISRIPTDPIIPKEIQELETKINKISSKKIKNLRKKLVSFLKSSV